MAKSRRTTRITRPNRPVTRDDVAKAAGVSLVTAALALNGHPRVASKTRERVADAAKRLGFVANHAARRLAGMRADARARAFGQVGLLYFLDPEVGGETVFLSIVGGVEEELSKLSASLVLVRIGGQHDWEKFDRLEQSGMVDAWLLFGNVNEYAVERVKESGAKHVVLGDHRCKAPEFAVNLDFRKAGSMAAEHLAGLGHERVAYFGGSMLHVYQQEMRAGFEEGARAIGLAVDPALLTRPADVFPIQRGVTANAGITWEQHLSDQAEHLNRLKAWLEARPDVTAIFTSEFEWARTVWDTLCRLGVQVPDRLSLLGCEPVTRYDRNLLFTRVLMPMHEIGRQGARLLQKCVQEPGLGAVRVAIAPAIAQGATTGGKSASLYFHLKGL